MAAHIVSLDNNGTSRYVFFLLHPSIIICSLTLTLIRLFFATSSNDPEKDYSKDKGVTSWLNDEFVSDYMNNILEMK